MSRVLTFLATAALLLVGLAAPVPAQAEEPVAPAAVTQFTWDPEPTVARLAPNLQLTLTMATHLYDLSGEPAAGERVSFTLLAKATSLYEPPQRYLEVCTAVADANGLATCQGNVAALLGSVLSLVVNGAYATHLIGPFPSQYDYTKLPVVL